MSLKEDYKNDMYEGRRKYNLIKNTDDTVSLDDVTQYAQEGDTFTASDVNVTNHAVNQMDKDNATFKTKVTQTIQGLSNTVDKFTNPDILLLPAAGWGSVQPFTQTITLARITENDSPIIALSLAGTLSDVTVAAQRKAFGYLDRVVSGKGELICYCYEKRPETDFAISVKGE